MVNGSLTWKKIHIEYLRRCLVCVFKQSFLDFKKHFTHFNTFFHPHLFSQIFSNNNFPFLNAFTKRHYNFCSPFSTFHEYTSSSSSSILFFFLPDLILFLPAQSGPLFFFLSSSSFPIWSSVMDLIWSSVPLFFFFCLLDLHL